MSGQLFLIMLTLESMVSSVESPPQMWPEVFRLLICVLDVAAGKVCAEWVDLIGAPDSQTARFLGDYTNP